MDQLESHIISLEQKIDRLYSVVEQLSNRIDEKDESRQTSQPISQNDAIIDDSAVSSRHRGVSEMMEHKDVLLDDETHSTQNVAADGEEVSPEIQIRRLNTQLTAAYNRIAALEEQLLTQRTHN